MGGTGLFGLLELGRKSLSTQQYALQITSHNISNANTPGYTRQEANIVDTFYLHPTYGSIGTGADVQAVSTFRNRFLGLRITQERQATGTLETLSSGLEQMQAILAPTSGSNVRDGLKNFFTSLQALSRDPSSIPLRQDVLTKANALAGSFRQNATQLQTMRATLDATVPAVVSEINDLTSRIAALNKEVMQAQVGQANDSDPRDQRDELIRQLSEKIGINYYEDNTGMMTVQLENGGLLVSGTQNQALTTSNAGPGSYQQIFSGATNVTASIRSGKLGAYLDLRDDKIPTYLNQLDTLAGTFLEQVNAVHQQGYDLNGATGTSLFTPLATPGVYTNAASSITVAITDPRGIAAARGAVPGPPAVVEPGNNVNVLALAGLATNNTFATLSNKTFGDYMQSLVTNLGVQTQTAEADLSTRTDVLTQLENMRQAESGVSLDEEAVNLIKFQRAFESVAKYVKVIDDLTASVIATFGGA